LGLAKKIAIPMIAGKPDGWWKKTNWLSWQLVASNCLAKHLPPQPYAVFNA